MSDSPITSSPVTIRDPAQKPESPHPDNLGEVHSMANYPIALTYAGMGMMLPPHGVLKGLKRALVGPLDTQNRLPKGAIFVQR